MAGFLDNLRSKRAREKKLEREMTHIQQKQFVNPIGDALSQYGSEVKQRVMNPAVTLRSAIDRMKSQPAEEMAMDWSNPVAGGLVGMFAGKGAKTANLAMLAKAEELAKSGVPDDVIWKQTGWTLKTPDGMPRFEIPDNQSQISAVTDLIKARNAPIARHRDEILARVKAEGRAPTNEEKFYVNNANMQMQSGAYRGEVGDVIKHDDLFNAYDNIKNRDLNWETLGGDAQGEWIDKSQSLGLSLGQFGEGAKSTTLHELQHAIQQREGFARGGSPEIAGELRDELLPSIRSLQDKIQGIRSGSIPASYDELLSLENQLKPLDAKYQSLVNQSPYESYQRLAGEAEARLTQSRMNLTPEERLAQYPYDPDYFNKATGVSLKDLIVRTQ